MMRGTCICAMSFGYCVHTITRQHTRMHCVLLVLGIQTDKWHTRQTDNITNTSVCGLFLQPCLTMGQVQARCLTIAKCFWSMDRHVDWHVLGAWCSYRLICAHYAWDLYMCNVLRVLCLGCACDSAKGPYRHSPAHMLASCFASFFYLLFSLRHILIS